jgi:hypothetical protein
MQIRDLENTLWCDAPQQLSTIHPEVVSSVISSGLEIALELGLVNDPAIAGFIQCQLVLGRDFWRRKELELIWQHPETEARFNRWMQRSQDEGV